MYCVERDSIIPIQSQIKALHARDERTMQAISNQMVDYILDENLPQMIYSSQFSSEE
jgi:hypothetical protein